MVTVFNSSRSVPPLAISLYDFTFSTLFLYPWRATIAAVRLVLPWSMWPIVPTLTCGLVRSNFFLAIVAAPGFLLDLGLLYEFGGQVARDLGVVAEFHRGRGAALGHAPQVRHVSEHLRER